jgi:hypothetical protein
MKSAAGAGGTTVKKTRKKKKKGERKKGGPKVMPVRGPSAFVVEEPADSIRRLKSTGHGRLKPIQTFIDEEPGEEQRDPQKNDNSGTSFFLDQTVPASVSSASASSTSLASAQAAASAQATMMMVSDLDYDEMSFGDALGADAGASAGIAGMVEEAPEEKWDFGAKEAQFGAHKGWARKGDDDGFAVADGEWDEIMKKVDAGIDDNDLNINDKIEEYLRDTGGLTAGVGVDLPVAEINNLVRQFSTRKKAAIFQECDQATEDTETAMSGLRMASTGPNRTLPIVGDEDQHDDALHGSPGRRPPLSPRHSDFGFERRADDTRYDGGTGHNDHEPDHDHAPDHGNAMSSHTLYVRYRRLRQQQCPHVECVLSCYV